MLHIGTSGFSYDDWVGPFYPQGLSKNEFLSFYAREFSTCELNFTYYRIPDARTLESMSARTPDDFLFTLKANREMTHEREDAEGAFSQFVAALDPLIQAGKLGCVLLQFPWGFKNTPENRDYLARCRERLQSPRTGTPLPAVVEFRNREWITDEVFQRLQALGLGFCCVDQPRFRSLIPPIARATGEVAYVRFHGRNAAKWWQHDEAWERYDYQYRTEELQEWVPKIRELDVQSRNTYVFANNHWQGQAVDTARQLRMLLQG
jgi:uncharacterized protein YecE (DUF72 family)